MSEKEGGWGSNFRFVFFSFEEAKFVKLHFFSKSDIMRSVMILNNAHVNRQAKNVEIVLNYASRRC